MQAVADSPSLSDAVAPVPSLRCTTSIGVQRTDGRSTRDDDYAAWGTGSVRISVIFEYGSPLTRLLSSCHDLRSAFFRWNPFVSDALSQV